MKPSHYLFLLLAGPFCASAQDIEWEKSYGGRQADYLFDIQPTSDYGFIVAGSSLSQKSGNKIEASNGDLDYWIWKMDEHGSEDWQKSFGGSGSDLLQSLQNTPDNGFILAGTSNSPKGTGKTDDCRGENDYWIIKLNAKGAEEWQKTYGGTGQDDLLSISPTRDGGYIVGGSSASDKTGDKTDNSNGNMDYWILKLDATGIIEWQKSFGGQYADLLRSLIPTTDGGYLLGGYSNSPQSKNKAADNWGPDGDFWVLKLDSKGMVEWQQTLGGDKDDQLYAVQQAFDGGFIIGGNSNSAASGNKNKSNRNGSDIWLLKLDKEGIIEWQQTYDFGNADMLASILENEDHSLLLGGYAKSSRLKEEEGINDYIVFSVSEKGEEVWRKTVGSEGEDILRKTIETRDGGYLLAGISNPESVKRLAKKGDGKPTLGISNGNTISGVQQAQDEADSAINNATENANDYITQQVDSAAKHANDVVALDKDSPFKIGMNGPTGSLLNPEKASGSKAGGEETATAKKGPKPGLKASRDKAVSYGNKDFWIVKLRDKNKEEKKKQSIEAFPNPAFLYTNVVVGFDFDKGTATVFDLSGRQLQQFPVTERTIPIELGSYPEGIYIVKIATNKGGASIKIIKSRK